MTQKFITLKTQNPDNQELVNPLFITIIRRVGNKTIVYTMDGNSIYTDDTVNDVLKKIKDTEKFSLDIK